MLRRETCVGALALVAIAVAVPGCGGGSPAKTTTSARPATAALTSATTAATAKRVFIGQADAICRQLRDSLIQLGPETRALGSLGDTPKAFARAAVLFRRVKALEQIELSRLTALKPPTADLTTVNRYFQQGRMALALLARLADDLARDDKPALVAAERQGSRMAATTKGLAQGYGFKVCGNGAEGNGLS